MFSKKAVKVALSVVASVLGFYVSSVLAEATNIGTMASDVTSTLGNIAGMLQGASYVAGIGLTIGSLFKFKQHKENPQQAPLGSCMAMLLVGISLIFMPSLVNIAGGTLGMSSLGTAGSVTYVPPT